MTVFFIVAALLLAGALMFVLPTLMRKNVGTHQHALRGEINLSVLRDQMRELDADLTAGSINSLEYESAKRELERRVVEDVQPIVASANATAENPWSAILIGLTIPAIAISLYALLGTPAAFHPAQVTAPQDVPPVVTAEQIAQMVARLEQRLKNKPDDVKGWNMLARSYHTLGRFRESADVYARLVKSSPDNADLLADYADALAMAQNRNLQGAPEKIIARALRLDPNNIKALALAGSAAFDRRDYQEAVIQWKKILLLVPPESDTARAIMKGISEAQSLSK